MTGVTLGIETSGFEGSVALRRHGEPLVHGTLAPRRRAQTLITQVRVLLEEQQLAPEDVDLVAVSHGPGSFTGLRVGVVFAKTFAFATGCQLVAVDTLQAIAAATPDEINHVSVVADAQREQLFMCDFRRNPVGCWERCEPICIMGIEAWCEHAALQPDVGFAVSGPGLLKIAERLRQSVQVLPESSWTPHAFQIAEIGEELAAGGVLADASSLEPFYLRLSAAEEKRDLRVAEIGSAAEQRAT